MKNITKYLTEYLSSKVIYALDIITSTLSAVIVLIILNFMSTPINCPSRVALLWISCYAVISALSMAVFKTYKVIVRHATIGDIRRYIWAIAAANILLAGVFVVVGSFNKYVFFALLANFFVTIVLALGVRFLMFDFYRYYKSRISDITSRHRILVYGTSDKAVAAISRFNFSRHYRLMGFICSDPNENNLKIAGYPVLNIKSETDFRKIAYNLSLYAVIFATEADVRAEESGLVRFCSNNGIKTLIIPSVDEFAGGKVTGGSIRQVKIEDILGRSEIEISMEEINRNFNNKVVMVTGAAGSIGSELCRQLATCGVKRLVLFDNAETPMHNLRLELEASFPELDFVPVIGSVRHKDRLDYAFRNWRPQVVFHAAAYKHVPLMEENPCEAVFANVHGSRMVSDKCVAYGVEMMVMISTDKAVNPTNIMGCSKRIAEIYVQSLGLALEKGELEGKTKFVTTRFGNVLGSNGSVVPHFREQIEHGGPVTVTHPDITRFFMTIPEACRLVMEAATISTGNQIFVFDMGEPVRIVDLAKRMIELAGLKLGEDIRIEFIGLRPGEKLYEEPLANVENTEPTSHDRIHIAKVREYSYVEVLQAVEELTRFSKSVDIPQMVKLMKRIVPEFKSNNSRFDVYD